jgi:release factor glutamine methyltransferase
MKDTQIIAQVLAQAEAELTAAGITGPRLDAEVLLAHSLDTTRAGLYARFHTALPLSQFEIFRQFLHRRLQREPLQYITGVQEFWSLEFAVDQRVLIPRPETELVVETVLHLFSAIRNPQSAIRSRILDVGTGSGCIAVALATELPDAAIWAADISSDALAVATLNARRHNVHQRIRFLQGDLFAPVAGQGHLFELIVSNPPYIARHDLLTLQPEIRNWEPRNALDGGEDGLNFYRRLLGEASHCLSANGWLVMEIGAGQDAAIMPLLRENEGFTGSFSTPDYAGRGRVVAARKK